MNRPAPIQFAILIRSFLMDNPQVPDDERQRMLHACHVLETGKAWSTWKALGNISMAELKRQYVAFVVDEEMTAKAASERLGIDPATIWRILRRPVKKEIEPKSDLTTLHISCRSRNPHNGR